MYRSINNEDARLLWSWVFFCLGGVEAGGNPAGF